MNSGYLRIPEENLLNLRYMDSENDNNQDDLVVIVTGNRHEPFYMLQRMCKGLDRLIAIEESDHVVIVTPPVPGTEKMAARTIDVLYKSTPNVIEIKKDMLKSTHADNQELQMLYNMLNPKYIIPIIGEYRHQYSQKQVALDAGYDESRIILLENGEVVVFESGQLLSEKQRVAAGDVLVDGSIIGDINEIVLKDRELLSQEGAVLISTIVDSSDQTLLGEVDVVTKGLILGEDVLLTIKTLVSNLIASYWRKWDQELLKNHIQQDVAKELKRVTKKFPIVASVIIDVAK
jgi:ribonuclease J